MRLARRCLAERLERWTCNSEVPSLSPALTIYITGFRSPEFESSTTFVNTQPAGLPEDSPACWDSLNSVNFDLNYLSQAFARPH